MTTVHYLTFFTLVCKTESETGENPHRKECSGQRLYEPQEEDRRMSAETRTPQREWRT